MILHKIFCKIQLGWIENQLVSKRQNQGAKGNSEGAGELEPWSDMKTAHKATITQTLHKA